MHKLKSHGYDEVDVTDTHVVSPALPSFVIQPGQRKSEIMFVYSIASTCSRISNIINNNYTYNYTL